MDGWVLIGLLVFVFGCVLIALDTTSEQWRAQEREEEVQHRRAMRQLDADIRRIGGTPPA